MNKKYWQKYYQNNKIIKPSKFSIFALDYISENASLLDMGCGVGRDSYFFGQNGINVLGVDFAATPVERTNVKFQLANISTITKNKSKFDVIYSRFFLHAIEEKKLDAFIKWSKGLFIAECRAKGDKPILYRNHKRHLVDGNKLIKKLLKNKFDILYYKKGYNMAVMKEENPLIIRIIGRK